MVGEKEFNMMKPTVRFINNARGPIVDESALIKALEEKKIWAAGLDVTEQEPYPIDGPLLHMPNVILTPHFGGSSVESATRVSTTAAQNIVDFFNGKGGDNHAHVAHDDLRRKVADILTGTPQQTAGCVLHNLRASADANNERGRHIYTNVLAGEGPLQRNINVDGEHESCTTVDTLGGFTGTYVTVNDKNFVGRAHLVTAEHNSDGAQNKDNESNDCHDAAYGITGSRRCGSQRMGYDCVHICILVVEIIWILRRASAR